MWRNTSIYPTCCYTERRGFETSIDAYSNHLVMDEDWMREKLVLAPEPSHRNAEELAVYGQGSYFDTMLRSKDNPP